MKPYSTDLRQKIIDVHENENISIRKLAKRFCVAKSFVQKLLKQYRETGDITPKKQGGSPTPKLSAEDLTTLVEIIDANNDATLEELCTLLEDKTKIKVSRATMGRITQKLNYTLKKKLYTQQKKRLKEFRKSELSFGRRSEIFR